MKKCLKNFCLQGFHLWFKDYTFREEKMLQWRSWGVGGGVIKRQQKTFEYIQPDFLYLFVVLSLDINDSVEEKNTRVQRQRINTLYLCLSAFSKIHPIPPINLTWREFMLPDAINCFVYCNPLPTFLTPGRLRSGEEIFFKQRVTYTLQNVTFVFGLVYF